MSIRTNKLPHRIVYWAPETGSKSGQPAYAAPVEMAGRWVPEERQVLTPAGSVITTKTVVWTELPLLKEGVLWKGTLDTLMFPDMPFKNYAAYTIREIAHHDVVRGTDGIDLAFV